VKTHYEILGIDKTADFTVIKKAYFRRAKECHPDRHGNSRQKEEEFKTVVHAFDILSDPSKRLPYDQSLGIAIASEATARTHRAFSKFSIMDTLADDILEELIVGNAPPPNATLATLMQDLERTETFITFREGKTRFFERRYVEALGYFRKALRHSPNNILIHCYLARTLAIHGKFTQAKSHYRQALSIGSRRNPPQHLARIRSELDGIAKHRMPWWHMLLGFFRTPDDTALVSAPEERLIEKTNETISRILDERKGERKRLE
jgi:curved DNA-binding protein CbpA